MCSQMLGGLCNWWTEKDVEGSVCSLFCGACYAVICLFGLNTRPMFEQGGFSVAGYPNALCRVAWCEVPSDCYTSVEGSCVALLAWRELTVLWAIESFCGAWRLITLYTKTAYSVNNGKITEEMEKWWLLVIQRNSKSLTWEIIKITSLF
jgi:hypothetical protein